MNSANKQAICPIVYASDCGFLEVVKRLAEMAPDLRKHRSKYLSVVSTATNCNFDIVKYLYSRGVDLMVKERGGPTAFLSECDINTQRSLPFSFQNLLNQNGTRD